MPKTDAEIIAEIYDEYGNAYHQSRASGRLFNEFIDIPASLSLLPPALSGQTILDAGCGSGLYARLLAEKGAQVTGIDVSNTMIQIAQRDTPSELGVRYCVGELSALPFEEGRFDYVLCTYVLENIGELDGVFREFHRVLKQSSRCIFSISHPLRAYAETEKRDGVDVWVLGNYFKRDKRQSDFGNGMIVPKYCRPVEDYVSSLANAGFVIERLLEPRPLPQGKDIDPTNFEKAERLPQVLCMRIAKAAVPLAMV